MKLTRAELRSAAVTTFFVLALVTAPATARAATATADAATKMQWSVKGPTTVAIGPGGAIPISVAIENDTPATNVALAKVYLVEDATKMLLDQGALKLCVDPAPPCNETIGALGRGPHTLWLVSSATTQPGKYVGSITIASEEKPDGDDVGLTVFVSTAAAKALGIALIAAGVIAAWLVTVVLRNSLNRLQLLVPAKQLQETLAAVSVKLADIDKDLANAGVAVALENTHVKFADVTTALSVERLEAKGLPPRFPMSYAATGMPSVTDYRTYLATQSSWVADLTIVVDGANAALDLFRSIPPATEAGLIAALQKFDAPLTGDAPPKADEITATVDGALATLGKTRPPGVRQLSDVPRIALPSSRELNVEISALNLVAWGFVAVATTLTGAAVLIYFSDKGPGFGTTQDYLSCIIWGLGLPAGAGLLGSTNSSVSTTFSITKLA